ncbi:MAG: hypothetical protein D3922_04965 [Candidatus Electrothrix sp. AR1]|nr:hypothetical protein [Candidatus Electrothrix sp. AR1]
MNEYRQAHSVALYDAGVTITNATRSNIEDNQGYPLATGIPPGSFRIPENDISALTSELKTKQRSALPTGRKQGSAVNLHKVLSSYNKTLGEEARVKNLLIRVEARNCFPSRLLKSNTMQKGSIPRPRK